MQFFSNDEVDVSEEISVIDVSVNVDKVIDVDVASIHS